MLAKVISKRFLLPLLLAAFVGVVALFPATRADAASATKACTLSSSNTYTCTFTITPAVATGAGAWLVQMVPGPGTIVGTPTVASATGCSATPGIVPGGTPITSSSDLSTYGVNVGSGGCTASAVVTVTEKITVTASGQVCQKVWVTVGSPFATNCATVVYTPPAATPTGVKTCTPSNTLNVYTCLYTVTPAFPAMAGAPGDYIHVNEPPGPPMTGPGFFSATPTVASVSGCGSTALPVVLSSGTSYNAWMGLGGCPGTVWSVTFNETVTVTASGQLCQSFWMVAAVPPTTACATVYFTPPPPPAAAAPSAAKSCTLTSTPNQYTCLYTVTPGFPAVPGDLIHVNEAPIPVVPNPGYYLAGTPTVGTVLGCSQIPTPVVVTSSYTYNAQIGSNGCPGYTWSVQFIETINVTASGQICQTFYMVAAVPPATACAAVVYTPPPPVAGPSAAKSCTLTSTANQYTCLYTVTPGFPAAASPPTPGGDYIHVNEAPGPLMTGPGTILPTPTVMSVSGCSSTALPVVMSIGNGYNAWMGVNGCPGTTWSVTFSETIVVTSSGQLCQSFWMVAAVPPTTACATVYFTKSLPVTPSPGKGTFASAPVYAMSKLASTVFFGGTAAELDAALITTAASGAWVQDSNGMFFLYIVGGGFVNGAFKAAFPTGLPNPSALTVVGR